MTHCTKKWKKRFQNAHCKICISDSIQGFGRTGPLILGGSHFGPWLENRKCCNQMRFASIQCSKIRLRPWLRPWPRLQLTAYTAPPDNLVGFKGAALWHINYFCSWLLPHPPKKLVIARKKLFFPTQSPLSPLPGSYAYHQKKRQPWIPKKLVGVKTHGWVTPYFVTVTTCFVFRPHITTHPVFSSCCCLGQLSLLSLQDR